MTQLTVYADDDASNALLKTSDFDEIVGELEEAGILLERWRANAELPQDADQETVIAAYQAEIDRLVARGGYQTWDVISLGPDHPDKDAMRRKFLDEHTHGEDEVRFFVRGDGLFYIHHGDRVFALLCEQNDLISVPAATRHWFDMGPNPDFTVLRLFNNPDGWIAKFTGDPIADGYPRHDN
jgi:1,2-dihydroxy-3-keto-5-methylthiopentene dioxygenase